jgi:hypothetical protein
VNDVLGRVDFKAPLDASGTDAILLAASIVAISEGTFSASNNATKLSFRTAASEAATEKMALSSAGVLTVSGAITSSASVALTGTTNNVGTITTGIWNAGAVTSSGVVKGTNLNVGITTPVAVVHLLSGQSTTTPDIRISYNAAGEYNFGIATFTSGGTANSKMTFLVSDGSTSAMVDAFNLSGGGVATFPFLASGNLTSASGVITSSSDERMKDILGPLPYGLKEVLRLQPIRAKWNKLAHKLQGLPTDLEFGTFGAQRVKRSMPLAIAKGKDGMLSLNDRVILGAVVNAIKELNKRMS